jgi:hypothetical protein
VDYVYCVQMMQMIKLGRGGNTIYIQDNLAGPSGSRATIPIIFLTTPPLDSAVHS